MKTVILYKTKYGSTQQYAEFVHRNAPSSDLFPIDEFNADNLSIYDTVIVGARTYMGNIEAISFLKSNWEILKPKRVFLFTVGMIDPDAEASKESYNKIPEGIRNGIRFLKVPGKIDITKLNWFERLVVKSQKGDTLNKMNLNMILPVIEFIKSA